MKVSISTFVPGFGIVRASANVSRNPFFARDTTGDEEPFQYEALRVLNARGENVTYSLSERQYNDILEALTGEFVECLDELAERRVEYRHLAYS